MFKQEILQAEVYNTVAAIPNAFGKIVAHTASGYAVATAATQTLGGVIYDTGDGGTLLTAQIDAGDSVHVATHGIVMIRAGAAIANGVELTTNANGEAITAVAGNRVVGIALRAATAAGEIVPARLTSPYAKP